MTATDEAPEPRLGDDTSLPPPEPAPEPAWVARFLSALGDSKSIREVAEEAGVSASAAYSRRKTHPAFEAAWEAVRPSQGRAEPRQWGGARRIGQARIDRFLEALAATSNVTAAAAQAGIETGAIYRLRRSDPDFARSWYAALAEGYDNLEMELLQHLRGGEGAEGSAKNKKFDTATALRCLTSHRETVAREKGRRSLEGEVATIAAINAKIDAGDKAIAKARKDGRARAKGVDRG